MLQNYLILKFLFLLALYLSANATVSEKGHEGSSETTKKMLFFEPRSSKPEEKINSAIKILESNEVDIENKSK